MTRILVALATVALLIGVYGCSKPPASDATSPAAPAAEGAHDEHADHDHRDADHGAMSDMEKMKAEVAKLSPEDAASAMKQHFCPVSGEMLGVMGAPIKVGVNGRDVWICCESCRDKLLENPDEYLAKLDQN